MAAVTDVLPGASAPAPTAETTGVDAQQTKDKNDNWRFIEPQPVREDQVENAVKFLSHPKVRGSPVVYRRSFLEKKGLSREEIDEAFRRVPDPPSESTSSAVLTTVTQTGIVGAVANPPLQVGQVGVPVVEPKNGKLATKSTSWTQMILALGVLTAAGAGAGVLTKTYFIPKFKEWVLEIVLGKSKHGETGKTSKPSPVEEAASAAAAAATQVAAALQEIAQSKSEDRQRLDSIVRAVEAQTQELKNTLAGIKDVVQSGEGTKYQRPVASNFQSNGVPTQDFWKGQTTGVRSTAAPEDRTPSNFGPVLDPSTGMHNNEQQGKLLSPASSSAPLHAPHSQSYLDVMAMLERGEKPPGIRDINDKPPNPNQPPSNPRLQPRPKPWEKGAVEARPISPLMNGDAARYKDNWNAGSASGLQSPVRTELTVGPTAGTSSSEPWWRKKADPSAGFNPSSVTITEVDPATETDSSTVGQSGLQPGSSSSSWQSGGRAGWVPPAVPQPIYPGAEEAIRRPKPAVGASARSVISQVESGSGTVGSSSSEKEESPPKVSAESFYNPLQPADTQPEQQMDLPSGPKPVYEDTSLVEPSSFKDVEQEAGDQQ